MIAIEVSSAAGKHAYGGIPRSIRNLVGGLLRIDPSTRYDLCYRFSRWRKGNLFRSDAPNARIRVIQDPFNAILMPRNRLFHSMGIFVPDTPHIPKLLTVHDLNAVRNVQWVTAHWHEKRSAKILDAVSRADIVVAVSRFAAEEIREEFKLPKERVRPILHGGDSNHFSPPSRAAIQKTRERYGDYVLAIGVLTPRKNFVRLLEAMVPLEPLRLVLVGSGSRDGKGDVEAAIEKHGLQNRVTRLEGIPEPDLIELLSAARVYAIPSLYEGFGLTVLEGMACGAPVVCSRAASLPEVAGDAAYMVDATSVEELSHAIERVAQDSELAASLRQRGLARAQARSWEQAARELRALYRDMGAI